VLATNWVIADTENLLLDVCFDLTFCWVHHCCKMICTVLQLPTGSAKLLKESQIFHINPDHCSNFSLAVCSDGSVAAGIKLLINLLYILWFFLLLQYWHHNLVFVLKTDNGKLEIMETGEFTVKLLMIILFVLNLLNLYLNL